MNIDLDKNTPVEIIHNWRKVNGKIKMTMEDMIHNFRGTNSAVSNLIFSSGLVLAEDFLNHSFSYTTPTNTYVPVKDFNVDHIADIIRKYTRNGDTVEVLARISFSSRLGFGVLTYGVDSDIAYVSVLDAFGGIYDFRRDKDVCLRHMTTNRKHADPIENLLCIIRHGNIQPEDTIRGQPWFSEKYI